MATREVELQLKLNPDIEIREGLVVRPGDTLVVRIDPGAVRSRKQFDEFAAHIRERCGRYGIQALVVGADQLSVVRQEIVGKVHLD